MKIAVLSPLKTEQAETFVQNHIAHLPFNKVVIYGGNFPNYANGYTMSGAELRLFRFIKRIKSKLNLPVKRLEAYRLEKILKKEKVQVVFAEYLITGAETVAVCQKLQIPMVAIALGYDISVHHILDNYALKYKELFKYASAILVVSEHMQENLNRLGCSNEKIHFTPAGPDASFFEVKPHFRSPQIVAVGRFVDKKAPHLTLLAFKKVAAKIPDAHLVMAGDGPLLNACKDLVQALGLTNKVNFVGRINPIEHRNLLEASTVFVQHSKTAETGDSEGTPVAILEASAAGLPVVSTLHAGIPQVVIDGETGYLVAENDVEAMAESIIALLADKKKAKAFGEKGRAYVQANFTLEHHIEQIANHLKEAAENL